MTTERLYTAAEMRARECELTDAFDVGIRIGQFQILERDARIRELETVIRLLRQELLLGQ